VRFTTAAAIVCLAGMSIGVITYWASGPEFISTSELEWPMVVTSLLVMFGLAHSFARKPFEELKDGLENGNSKAIASTILRFTAAGAFVWLSTLEFFSGPLSYLLHLSSADTDTVRTIAVTEATPYGHRRCRNHAILQLGGDAIWASRLCHLSDNETEQLRRGGTIQAYGMFTRYGMQITSFKVVSAGQGIGSVLSSDFNN
jgi:hypothetical protein